MAFDDQYLRSKGNAFSQNDLGLFAQGTNLNPFDPSHALTVLRVNKNITQMETLLDVSFRVLRREHMIKSMIPWAWLHVLRDRCYSSSCSISANPNTPNTDERSHWLTRLVTDIRSHLFNRSRNFVLEASVYLPGITSRFRHRSRNMPIFDNKGDERVANLAISVIKEWLCYPTVASWEARALFIGKLVAEWGTSSLLLEETWSAFKSVYPLVFTDLRRTEVPREHDLDLLSVRLHSSPLADPESIERKNLDNAAQLYNFKDEYLIQFYSRSGNARAVTYRRSLHGSK